MRGRILTTILLASAVTLAVPAFAFAQGAPAVETSETQTERQYDLDFTLPTAGKSGCTVCHADPSLVRIQDGQEVSLYVDVQTLEKSAHANVACTGCHVDFAFQTPHENVDDTEEWRRTAKSACSSCHKNEADAVNVSAHSATQQKTGVTAASASGAPKEVPLCGDCHGSHAIPSLQDTATPEAVAFHASGIQMCGQCHEGETELYDDYYHGAAYQAGAYDAPACWDCHSAHSTLPTDDPKSQVNPANLQRTCEQCHSDTNEQYVSYSELVHRQQTVYDGNPVYTFFESVRVGISALFEGVQSWFQQ